MKTICFASKKGGVSKTTSSIITALILSQKKKVLLIDLDSQNALTSFFFENIEDFQNRSILEAVKGDIPFEKTIFNITPNLDVIPSKIEFEEIDYWPRTGKEMILKMELKSIADKYDYVVIDTPPNLSTQTVLGLVASDVIVIPARLEKMDTRAINFTIDKINNQIREFLNPTLEKVLILPTQYNYQNRSVNDLSMQTLKETYPDMILDIYIPYSSKISQFNYVGFANSNSTKNFPEYYQLVEVL
jgi:cellulose biosynthesis protein BcsQ